jgi:hypothetical protein
MAAGHLAAKTQREAIQAGSILFLFAAFAALREML